MKKINIKFQIVCAIAYEKNLKKIKNKNNSRTTRQKISYIQLDRKNHNIFTKNKRY